ncbi:MAG TPA: DUF882 domain-containing protein [Polyangia bacterium]|nr:DUF882 domain-containing protein [Polyangia bacterium]
MSAVAASLFMLVAPRLLPFLFMLASVLGSTSALAATAPKAKSKRPPKNGPVVLYTINHKETFPLRLRDAQGKPIKGNQRRFDRFLRCHHTEAKHAMNPRLMRLLYQTGRHWPGRRLEIVSGYRAPSVAKNPHSPHMKGLACDFRVDGVKTSDLRDYLRKNFQKVGVGYYPNSTFVHLDVRKDRSAFWIDYSGPGERAVYSENPNDDLRSGRADSYHPTKIDESWAADETSTPADPGGAPAAPKDVAQPSQPAKQ